MERILPNLAEVLTRYELAINLKIAKALGLGGAAAR